DLAVREDLELDLGELAGRRLGDRQRRRLGGELLELRRGRRDLGLDGRRLRGRVGGRRGLGRGRLHRHLVELLGRRLWLRRRQRLGVARLARGHLRLRRLDGGRLGGSGLGVLLGQGGGADVDDDERRQRLRLRPRDHVEEQQQHGQVQEQRQQRRASLVAVLPEVLPARGHALT